MPEETDKTWPPKPLGAQWGLSAEGPELPPDLKAGIGIKLGEAAWKSHASDTESEQPESASAVALVRELFEESGGNETRIPDIDLSPIEAGLRSADSVHRARAVNALQQAEDILQHSAVENFERSSDELLDLHVVAPSELRDLLRDITGQPAEAETVEPFAPEELLVVAIVDQLGTVTAEQAESKDELVAAGRIFGAQTETSMSEQLAAYHQPLAIDVAPAFLSLAENERRKTVAATFKKLRRRAMQRLHIPYNQKSSAV